MFYSISNPDEFIAVTGMGVVSDQVKIIKSGWVFPFQRGMRFSVQPRDYSIDLQAMTKEKLQFLLPVIFTVGPDVNQRGANAGNIKKGDKKGDIKGKQKAVDEVSNTANPADADTY